MGMAVRNNSGMLGGSSSRNWDPCLFRGKPLDSGSPQALGFLSWSTSLVGRCQIPTVACCSALAAPTWKENMLMTDEHKKEVPWGYHARGNSLLCCLGTWGLRKGAPVVRSLGDD